AAAYLCMAARAARCRRHRGDRRRHRGRRALVATGRRAADGGGQRPLRPVRRAGRLGAGRMSASPSEPREPCVAGEPDARNPDARNRAPPAPYAHVRFLSAGAGSGKTYRLTQALQAALIDGVSPARIIGTTFTVKAAAELRERVREKLIASGRLELAE